VSALLAAIVEAAPPVAPPLISAELLAAGAAFAVLSGVLLLGYIKLSVVLAVLRRGLSGIPPASVTAILALLLSVFAMAPLYDRCQQAMKGAPTSATSAERLEAGLFPLREFLERHTPAREQTVVKDLALRLRAAAGAAADPADKPTLPALVVAFALSELRAAFQIAFVLLLPFLLIDLICASLVAGLLLPGLSPRAVALPFKLLLFVLCDGWQLLTRGLLSAYGAAAGGGP
jgi:flagellar biosynthetic protein FliP